MQLFLMSRPCVGIFARARLSVKKGNRESRGWMLKVEYSMFCRKPRPLPPFHES
jgi:hypothetical protein